MKQSILFLAVVLIITSCTVYKEYPIDIYKPGEAFLPPNAENIALVYRNFKYDTDTLQHYFKSDKGLRKIKNDPKNLDSLLATACLNELALNLKKGNENRKISVYTNIFKPHSAAKIPAINTAVLNDLAAKTNSGFVILLETHSWFYAEYPSEQGGQNPREVLTADVWSAYNPATGKFTDRKNMIDTVFWNSYDDAGNYNAKSKLPPRITALKIASQMAGENYAKRYLASWVNVKRSYSVPPLPDFEAADKYIANGEWDNAIELWKKYAADKNGKMAINARYNLALGYEMKDDIDAALQWISASQKIATDYHSSKELKLIEQYKNILVKRKKEIDLLNQQ